MTEYGVLAIAGAIVGNAVARETAPASSPGALLITVLSGARQALAAGTAFLASF